MPLSPPSYQDKELDVMGFLVEIGLQAPVEKHDRSSSANPHGDNLNLAEVCGRNLLLSTAL